MGDDNSECGIWNRFKEDLFKKLLRGFKERDGERGKDRRRKIIKDFMENYNEIVR